MQYSNMAVNPVSLGKRTLLNRQAFATSGMAFRMPRITPNQLFPRSALANEGDKGNGEEPLTEEPLTPKHEYEFGSSYGLLGEPDIYQGYYRGMNRNDMLAFLEDKYYEGVESGEIEEGATDWNWRGAFEEYREKFKIPPKELRRLEGLPAGEMPDPTLGMEEGQTNLAGFGLLDSVNQTGLAIQKGDIKGSIVHGLSAIAKGIALPGQIAKSVMIDPLVKGFHLAKGALSAPANSGSSVASGTGVSGLSGPMGLAAVDPGLADIGVNPDMGFGDGLAGFGDGLGSAGGMGHGPAGDGGFGEGPGW